MMTRLPSRQLLSTATAAVVSASTLKKAIAAATANHVIVVRASFNVSSTIKVEKSLRFQASAPGVTIVFIGASPPLTTYGIRVFGTSKLKVSFRGLTFDGVNIDRTLVSCSGVTMKRFRLVPRGTQVEIAARGAALSANVGARVSILASTVCDNYAAAGGALHSTGRSQMYLCQVTFAGNGAGSAASLAGVEASSTQDVWVGNLSGLVMLSRSSPAAVSGNLTSSIVDDPTQLQSDSIWSHGSPSSSSPTKRACAAISPWQSASL
eukprot:jgi/Mesen1/4443/ME000225S03428